MIKVVFIRHGESTWNRENRFTGWTDVDLSSRGVDEAREAGRLLRNAGYTFDLAFTSVLKRAIRTLWIVQESLDLYWIPDIKDWRLNERHYGALQGLNKAETAARYGEDQVYQWRRGFSIRPPALDPADPRIAHHDRRYGGLASSMLPLTESLEDTMVRSMACWSESILPRIRGGQRVLIVAHGNTLRALVKHLDQLASDEVMELNIPTGVPLVYEFDDTMNVMSHYYLTAENSTVNAA